MSQTPLVVWLTSKADRRDHAVTDTEMEAGCTARQGEFLAVCGRASCSGLTGTTAGKPAGLSATYLSDIKKIAEAKLRALLTHLEFNDEEAGRAAPAP